jgi:hypothetical protein
MISERTVLVLGAGASKDYGYPTALELRDKILDGLVSTARLGKALLALGHDKQEIERFRIAFERSSRPSIDAFLERREEFTQIGKRAIAATLIPLETASRLPRRGKERWYDHLWDVLVERDGNFADNRMAVITFNYDRSFEHYFALALRETYDADPETMRGWLTALNVIHVHGDLGGTPFVDQDAHPYTRRLDAARLAKAAERIKIVDRLDDGTKPDREFARAQEALRGASRVCFLGFGYNQYNIRRLRFAETAQKAAVFGTAYQMTQTEIDALGHRLGDASRPRPLPGANRLEYLPPLDCLQYLRRFNALRP